MVMLKKNNYICKDLYLSAYIYSRGVPLIKITKDPNEKYFWFIFSNPQLCEAIEEKYWAQKVTIKLHQYLTALANLKQRLSNVYSQGR